MRVLVTGASRGIGAALVAGFRAAGDAVTGASRHPGPGDLALDVTDPASHAALAQSLDGVALDILVCNAGTYPDRGQRIDGGFPAAMWAEALATNVTGVFLTIQTLLPNLRAAGQAKIAIISSQMGASTKADGGSYIYRASKAAVTNLGQNLASDLRAEGISVGIYHPGWVKSDLGTWEAEITADASAKGLIDRIGALSVRTTGCFETWDGRVHRF